MTIGIKVYKTKDFIRKNQKGQLDLEHSIEMVQELAVAVSGHADYNILVDLRDVDNICGPGEMMRIAMEFVHHRYAFQNKLAMLILETDKAVTEARFFKTCMDLKGFEMEFFTNYELAIDWLSEVKELGPGKPG
jgi:hypothetical protein